MSRRLVQLIADKVAAGTGYTSTLDGREIPSLLRKGKPVVWFPMPTTNWGEGNYQIGELTGEAIISVPGKGDDVASWDALDAAFIKVKRVLDDEGIGVQSQQVKDITPEQGAPWTGYEVTYTATVTDAHY